VTIKVAINGFGRIGRMVLRAHYESGKKHDLQFVAVNDLGDAHTNAHLLQYDTAHGRFPQKVSVDADSIVVGKDRIRVVAERDPAKLPWKSLGVDVVMECTGLFTSKAKAGAHLQAGARKVIISAPGDKDVDRTVVFGVNHNELTKEHLVISNASCTTNCLAPAAKVLHEAFGIKKGWMTTVHSYTNDQNLLDLPHKDLRRARAAALSIIPTTTGAATAVGEVLPELKGRLDGIAMRVPTANVSVVDLAAVVEKPATKESVNQAFRTAAEGPLKGILTVSDAPLVSIDFRGNPYSSIVDSAYTAVMEGDFVKILSWYDNEWGYSKRCVDLLQFIAGKGL